MCVCACLIWILIFSSVNSFNDEKFTVNLEWSRRLKVRLYCEVSL